MVNLTVMSRQVSPNPVIIQKYSKSEGGLQVTFPRKDIDQLGHSVSRYAQISLLPANITDAPKRLIIINGMSDSLYY